MEGSVAWIAVKTTLLCRDVGWLGTTAGRWKADDAASVLLLLFVRGVNSACLSSLSLVPNLGSGVFPDKEEGRIS